MKWIKLFDSFNKETFVGYHCTDSGYQEYDGFISSDYFDRFETILQAINNREAFLLLQKIKTEGIEYDSVLSFDIENYFNEIKLRWIFVDEEESLTRYGKICYSVYFKKINSTIKIKDYNESESDSSYIYLYYDDNKPIFYKKENHL